MQFGIKLKEIRDTSGLTQKEFSMKLNIKQNTLSTYENCISEPSASTLLNLFNNFDISPYCFFDLENPLSKTIKINDVLLVHAKNEALKYGMSIDNYIEHLIIEDIKRNN